MIPTSYSNVFPDFGPLPPIVAAMLNKGELVDVSYGNDTMPSFILKHDEETVDEAGGADSVPVLWVDYSDDAKREEHGNPRFMVQILRDDYAIATDEEGYAISKLRELSPTPTPPAAFKLVLSTMEGRALLKSVTRERPDPINLERYSSPLGEVELVCSNHEREACERGTERKFESDVLTALQFHCLVSWLKTEGGLHIESISNSN